MIPLSAKKVEQMLMEARKNERLKILKIIKSIGLPHNGYNRILYHLNEDSLK